MMNGDFTTGQIRPVEIFREAWELIKPRYWPLLGLTILGILIGSAVPVVLIGPMMCGIFLMYFRVIQHESAGFDELFKGFDFIWKSLPVSILIMVPVFVLIIVIYIPMIAMAIAGPRMGQTEMFTFLGGWLIFEFIAIFVMVCFHTLLMFAFPLVADRRLSGLEAVKLSIRAVRRNLKGVAGLMGVGAAVAVVGYLFLCVGVYFTLPLILMSQAVAYRRVFPMVETRAIYDPPAPNVYNDLS